MIDRNVVLHRVILVAAILGSTILWAIAGEEARRDTSFWPDGQFWPGGTFWDESQAAFMYGPVPVHPSPEPFTLNGYDATQAVWMIRRAGLLLWEPAQGPSEIIAVRERSAVRAVPVGTDDTAPGPQHRDRYDIEVNGQPLDWRNTFIRYRGRMTNLQALFSYRNQTPPEGLRYQLDR